nr:zinc finger, CCHC-type, retrotransposon Gag domain protein [Tanacetum cinerariifolium]
AAAGTEEEQAKNFQWILCRSTLNHLMCMSYSNVAQVANAARNYEILHERDDDDTERPDKRQKSDRQSGGDNHRSNNNYSGSNNRFKKLFFLQFFPRAEQERLKREYHSIRQTSTETSTEFMQRFLQLAGRGGNDNHRSGSNNNNHSSSNNRNSGNGRDQR